MTQKFNDHQRRLWSGMLQTLIDYRTGKIRYSEMVGDLEGALDAGDFEDNIRNKWYDLWTPLEISRATKGDNTKPLNVDEYVSKMKEFLEDSLKS